MKLVVADLSERPDSDLTDKALGALPDQRAYGVSSVLGLKQSCRILASCAEKSVATLPGQTALTRRLCPRRSSARLERSPISPHFEPRQIVPPAKALFHASEQILLMCPPLGRIPGATTGWQETLLLGSQRRLDPHRSHCRRGMDRKRPTPAPFTRISISPSLPQACSIIR